MPTVRFDILEGRQPAEVRKLLDAAHRAIVAAFEIPPRDRYQIVHQHPRDEFVVQDSGLNLPRSGQVVLISITSRPRSTEQKMKCYVEICRQLKDTCGIEESDVIISIVTNDDADWSFGRGHAQFLTGEL